MVRDQHILDLSAELIIDNFACGGGASHGIEQALGRHVDVAINHDREALAMHEVNHPQTRHLPEDVFDVDPIDVTKRRPVGLAWFSPDCTHFSKARGTKPRSKKIRGLAWVVLRWAVFARPRVIIMENVEEFLTWGPLASDGQPCPMNKGRTFRTFVDALTIGIAWDNPDVPEILEVLGSAFPIERLHAGLGYAFEHRELRACDFGAPTIRKRLFAVARCDGVPIVWPKATHGDPKRPEFRGSGLKPWRAAAECIEWWRPCPSIFERKRPLADATCRRVAKGIMRHVVNDPEPFIVPLTHHDESARHYPVSRPMQTVTGANRGEMALVAPVLTEHANASKQRVFDVQDPLRTQCAEVKGGHFALVSAFLAKHYGGVVGQDIRAAMGTVTATDHHSLVLGHLSKMRGQPESHAPGQDQREPLHTVSAQGNHFAEVRAFLVKYYGNEKEAVELLGPMHTVTSRDRFGLVTVHGQDYAIDDIGLRMLAPRELFRAQGFPDSYVIDRGIFIDRKTGVRREAALTKTSQVKMCGNSVCPPLAAALVSVNVPELAVWSKDEAKRRRSRVA